MSHHLSCHSSHKFSLKCFQTTPWTFDVDLDSAREGNIIFLKAAFVSFYFLPTCVKNVSTNLFPSTGRLSKFTVEGKIEDAWSPSSVKWIISNVCFKTLKKMLWTWKHIIHNMKCPTGTAWLWDREKERACVFELFSRQSLILWIP